MVSSPRVVITSGAFDLIHPGHIFLLRYAKKLAGNKGKLIVVIARDITVLKRKGRKPILSESDRLKVVNSIRYVDKAVLGFKPMSFKKIIEKYRPNIVVFGYDQEEVMSSFKDEARKHKWDIRIVRAPVFSSRKKYSTTQLIYKARNLRLAKKR
ncbi:MAG: adenylyltransferase/cytidyltransferase family protein [Nitrososphaerota archaeon]